MKSLAVLFCAASCLSLQTASAEVLDGGPQLADAGAADGGTVAAAAGQPEATSGVHEMVLPKLVGFVEAEYPREALDKGAEGDVLLDIDLDDEGHVSAARIVKDPGYGMGAAALDAVKKFVFTPAVIGGRAHAVTLEYTYQFRQKAPPADAGGADAGAADAGIPPAAVPARDTVQQGAQPQHEVTLESTVEAAAPTSAASSSTVRDRDLILRPHATPEDILRVVPGLVIAQHQGGGKADQLFLRGFDADHGTDVAIFVDDAPVNMPSHGHGQGFADLHFLIPEVIDRIDVSKGPYYPEYGDFDTAGAVNLHTRKSFSESSLSATYGSFQSYRVLGIAAPKLESGLPWLAAAVEGTQGPFQNPEGLQRYNIFSKDTLALGAATELAIQANLYGSQWSSSGQLPLRAVDSGELDRFGSIDPTEGGQTQRQELIATLTQHRDLTDTFKLTVWAIRYRVRLFSDFTFQLRDPAHFDEIEQDDERFATGLSAHYDKTVHLGSAKLVTTLGTQARYDDIHTALWHDEARVRLTDCFDQGINPCDDAQIAESSLSAYLSEDLRIGRVLRVVAGVRGDLFEFDVDDLKPQGTGSGTVQKSVVNPKLQVVVRPTSWWDIYLDAGGGFHSNDARSVVSTGGDGALPRAWGGEVGSRVHLFDRLDFAFAVWELYLQSEQTFSADDDSTSPSGATNRYGLDLEVRYEILPWLWADADLALAHAVYTHDAGNGTAVALAPTRTGEAGISAIHPSGWKARLGLRYVGDRPAIEDGSLTAEGYTLLDLSGGYRWRFVEVGVVVENLLNSEWREAQFANDSQLRIAPYDEAQPVTDIHFTPGNPLSVRGALTFYY